MSENWKKKILSRKNEIPHFSSNSKAILISRWSPLSITSKFCRNQHSLLTGSWVKVKIRVSNKFIVFSLVNTNLFVPSEKKSEICVVYDLKVSTGFTASASMAFIALTFKTWQQTRTHLQNQNKHKKAQQTFYETLHSVKSHFHKIQLQHLTFQKKFWNSSLIQRFKGNSRDHDTRWRG